MAGIEARGDWRGDVVTDSCALTGLLSEFMGLGLAWRCLSSDNSNPMRGAVDEREDAAQGANGYEDGPTVGVREHKAHIAERMWDPPALSIMCGGAVLAVSGR